MRRRQLEEMFDLICELNVREAKKNVIEVSNVSQRIYTNLK